MAYVFVTGDAKVTASIIVEDSIKQILWWIGFTTEEERNIIYDDPIKSFSDIRMFIEKYIYDLSSDIARRTQANGKIHFGMRRTKRMKALLHWVQYFYRISEYPTVFEMNEVMFIIQFETALYRADIRKKIIHQSNTKDQEASTGPLESENKWKEWESKFINYFSILIGFNRVPLSYVVQ